MDDYFCCALCGAICALRSRTLVFGTPGNDEDSSMDDDTDDEEFTEPSSSPIQDEGHPNQWLEDFRGFGFDDGCEFQKYFLTGLAEAERHGYFAVTVDGTKVPTYKFPGVRTRLRAYQDAIPVHDLCFNQILPRALRFADPLNRICTNQLGKGIDREILYSCMMETLHRSTHKRLDLIYFPRGAHEKIRTNPVDISELKQYYTNLPRLVDCTIPANQKARKDKFSCSSSDPFEGLPYEILIEIFIFLPVESIAPFQIASCTADIPLPNHFWRRRIKNDMPWLWDLFGRAAMTKSLRHVIDWRKVYAFLKTRSGDSFHGRIYGLVNRRRIWNVCSQLAVLYVSKINPQKPPKSGREDVCEEVCRRTICSLIPSNSRTDDVKLVCFKTFMLLHISDLQRSLTILTTYWNEDERLIGISMTMTGRSRRLFGHENSIETCMKSVILEKGDWIDYLVAGLDDIGITSLKISTLNRRKYAIGRQSCIAVKKLRARAGMVFAGLGGETLYGVISSISLLEYPKRENCQVAAIPYAEWLLWTPHTSAFDPEVFATVAHPQRILARTLSRDLHVMTPHFFFNHWNGEVNYLSCLAFSSDLQNIKVYHHGMKSLSDDEELQMKGFIIDAKGGEKIVGIEVEVAALPSSLRVVTNRGRQMTFGSPKDAESRYTYVPGPDHCVAGIYTCKNFQSSEGATKMMDIISMLSCPGENESHLMRPPNLDENGLIWESTLPYSDWIPIGPVYGCANAATVVTWLDLTDPVLCVQGLFSASSTMDIIDLDGIRVFAPSLPLRENTHDEWIRYHAYSITIGTPPGRIPDRIQRPDCKTEALGLALEVRDKPVEKSTHRIYENDKVDGAVSHVEEGEDTTFAGEDRWHVPDRRISDVTVWSGAYIHGFQFHSRALKNRPGHGSKWGKCGGTPRARWRVGWNCMGLKFFLGHSRGNRIAADLKIIGVQRLVDRNTYQGF